MKASVNFYWESFILNKDASSLSQDMTVLIVRVYLLFGGDFEDSSVGDVSKWVFSISHSLSMNTSANIKMIVIIFSLILNCVLPVELGSLHPTTQLLLQCVQVLRCHSSN